MGDDPEIRRVFNKEETAEGIQTQHPDGARFASESACLTSCCRQIWCTSDNGSTAEFDDPPAGLKYVFELGSVRTLCSVDKAGRRFTGGGFTRRVHGEVLSRRPAQARHAILQMSGGCCLGSASLDNSDHISQVIRKKQTVFCPEGGIKILPAAASVAS